MKVIVLTTLMISVVSLHAADMLKVLECHDKIVRQGVATLVLPKEVEALFGATNVDHFVSEFGGLTPMWRSVAYFGDRYRLTLRVPIVIDHNNCELLGASNSAFIQINEVTGVEISTSGVAGGIMKGQWRLNENEWKWLVKNNGDWSTVKVPILTNAPVKGFDEFVRQARAPIRNRREGFDQPIKEALERLRNQKKGDRQAR